VAEDVVLVQQLQGHLLAGGVQIGSNNLGNLSNKNRIRPASVVMVIMSILDILFVVAAIIFPN
jgi:hypothetical protein